MIDVDGPLMDSWQELLDGVISVPFCKTVSDDINGHYVWVYIESSNGDDTKHSFNSEVIVRTDIVTRFEYEVDKSIANGIDNEIKGLVRPGHGIHGLMDQPGMQIVHVRLLNGSEFEEYVAGQKTKYYRKIVRYRHTIVQTT